MKRYRIILMMTGIFVALVGALFAGFDPVTLGFAGLLGAAVTAPQLIEKGPNDRSSGKVAASTILYGGTICFIDASTGGLTGSSGAGANLFGGVVPETYDNSGGALGDVVGDRWIRGQFTFHGAGFVDTDLGKLAYAVDNFTVSTTAAGNSEMGVITRVVSATEVVIDISPSHN